MRDRWQRVLSPLIGVLLFVASLGVLSHELHSVSWQTLRASVLGTAHSHLLAALFLTVVNYVILTGYDFLAFRYLGKALAWWRIGVASFLAFAIANNVGFAMLSGTSVRYRCGWACSHSSM